MDRENDEKREMYLTLFGLDEGFSPEELSSSYRALARLNHPDLTRDAAAEMRMVIINEGYSFLKSTPGPGAPRRHTVRDGAYAQYRKAFDILRGAFDDYFGRPGVPGEGDIALLRERLSRAKDEFSRVINGFPYNEWVDDAIDRIAGINRWMGEKSS